MDYHTISVCSRARVSLITGVDHHIGGIAIKRSQKEIPYLNMTVRTFSLNRVHGISLFIQRLQGKDKLLRFCDIVASTFRVEISSFPNQ
jgi:hypothetical protein